MAASWIASFKSISWTKVLSVAPSIVDGARKLWTSVARKNALEQETPGPTLEKAYSHDPIISAIEKQMHALELRAGELEEQMASSSEILDKLAEQQTQLVQAVDILRIRTRALLWLCGFLTLACLLLMYLVVGR